MNTRIEQSERYIFGNVQLEHSVLSFNDAKPTETYFLSIDGEETVLSTETFRRICSIIEAVKYHDTQA